MSAARMTVFAAMAVSQAKMIVLIGPTASGKSALAMGLASRLGGEILSVDSMQVYRGMDIGTAKPTVAERKVVRHWLIDLVDPDQSYTVAKFVEAADAVVTDAARRGVPLIVTGGTPLYYKALFEGLFDGPPADPVVRERLMQIENEQLHQRLAEADPAAALRIHANDTRRLVRALEVFELTGRPITSFQTDWDAPKHRHDAEWFGLSWDKQSINHRINARVKSMMAGGWLEESRGLLKKFGTLSPTAGEATGYRELFEHLQGRSSLDDAVEQIKIATRQLARRQMKWFKRFSNVRWIAGDQPWESIADQMLTTRQ